MRLVSARPEPRAALLLGEGGVELLELDEQAPQVLGLDAHAGVLDLEAERLASPSAPTRTVTRPPSGVNLIAFDR